MAEFSIPQRIGALLRENPELVTPGPIPGVGTAAAIAKRALPSLGDISETGQYLGATVVPAVGGAVGDFLSGIGSGTDPRKLTEAFAAQDAATEQPMPAGAMQLQAFRPPDESDTSIETGPKPVQTGGGLFGPGPAPQAPAPVSLTQQEIAAIQSLPMAGQREQAARALIARKRAAATAQGQGGPGFATATTTTRNVQTESPDLDPAVAQRLLAQRQQIADQKTQAAMVKADATDTLLADSQRLHKQWQAEQEQYRKTLGEKGDALHSRFAELDREFEAMRKDFSGTKVSPLAGFDKTSQALLVVAAALEGGSAAARRQPSNLSRAIGMAVQTDLAAQRMNLRQKLQSMNMTERQRDQALARYDQIEAQKGKAAARAAQLQIAEIAVKSKRLDNKFAATEAALGMRDQLALYEQQLSEKATPEVRTSTVTQTRQVPVGPGGPAGRKLKTLPPGFIDKMNKRWQTLKEGDQILAELNELKSLTPIDTITGKIGKVLWGGENKHGTVRAKIVQWAKALAKQSGAETGPITEKEAEVLLNAFMGGGWDKLKTSKNSAVSKIANEVSTIRNTVQGLSQTHDVSPLSFVGKGLGVNPKQAPTAQQLASLGGSKQ